MNSFTIGVLALQGDVEEHLEAIDCLGAKAIAIKYPEQLKSLDGLIIPGGESTTLDILFQDRGENVIDSIKQLGKEGLPIYGTCMGSILLAKKVLDARPGQRVLELMDITVRRNAYGSQKSSFECELNISGFDQPLLNAVFIRAPQIVDVSSNVSIMASIDDSIVMARQDNLLVTTFHPEVTDDLRVHELFLEIVASHSQNKNIKSNFNKNHKKIAI